MKRSRHALALGLLTLSSLLSARAATTPAGRTEDLGQGLTYIRPAASTPASLALLQSASGPVVLDLRYFSPAARAPDWLAALKTFASPRRVCLVLVSPELTPDLATPLSAGLPGCLTLGRATPALPVDIPVNTTAEADRQAADSIARGADLAKLITDTPDKPRYDEAVLAKDHAAEVNGTADDTPSPDSPAADDAPAAKPATPPAPKPLLDAVLQRAVQIDRGLLALRRL